MDARNALTRLLALTAALAASAVVASAQPAAPPLTEITYGNLGPSSGAWPLFIAQQQGFFRDEGLKLAMVPFAGPQDVMNAVATHSVDLGEVQTDTPIEAIAHGLDVRIVAPTMTTVPYRLVALPTIASWSQLEGATISLGSKIGSTVIAFRRMLLAHKLRDDQFSIIVAGNSTLRLAALRSGNVQATMLAQPFDFLAQSQGFKIMADSNDVLSKDWIFSAMMVQNAWGSANKPLVARFLRAFRKAIAYGYAHRDDAVTALATNVKVDRETAEKTYDLTFAKWKAFDRNLRVDPAAIANMVKVLAGYGDLVKTPAVDEIVDSSYVALSMR